MEIEPPQDLVRKFGWRFYVFAVLMAVLAPLLADSLHTFFVVRSGIRFFNAELGRIIWPGFRVVFWVFVGLRGTVSFFVIWFFVWARFRDLWVWCCLVFLWMCLDFQMEIANDAVGFYRGDPRY